jgi:hypothetical protein
MMEKCLINSFNVSMTLQSISPLYLVQAPKSEEEIRHMHITLSSSFFNGIMALHPEWTYDRGLAAEVNTPQSCAPIGSCGSCKVVDQAPSTPYRERTLPMVIPSPLFRRYDQRMRTVRSRTIPPHCLVSVTSCL